MALATIAAGLSIGSSLLGVAGGLKANKEAKKAAERQAKMTFLQRQEEIRRAKNEYEGITSYNKAAIGASGLRFTGSPMSALQNIQNQFSEDIQWRDSSARMERRAIREGAPGRSADLATIAQGVGSIGGTLLNYNS